MLFAEEISRYQRHLSLDQVGEEGQNRLKSATVLIVGMGGLGCPAAQYLVAAGVGRLILVDYDKVSPSNLQRQILYSTDHVGQSKVIVAKEKLRFLNPNVDIVSVDQAFTFSSALDLVKESDVVIDGSDNFQTKYLINDTCVLADKPMVYASVYKFQGQLSVFNYKGGPSYRCLFPDEQSEGDNCEEVGVLGVVPGLLGVLQAVETIKIILQLGEVLSGKLKIIDVLTQSAQLIDFERNDKVIAKILNGYFWSRQVCCGVKISEIYLDVRESFEQPRISSGHVLEIPLRELQTRYNEVPRDGKVVVCCQSGIRSKQAIQILANQYGYDNLVDLPGGIKSLKR